MTRTQKITAARERTQEIRETAEQWEVTEPGGTVQSAPGGIYVCRTSDGCEVARIGAHYLDSRDERRNAARLIAAAPELLAALKIARKRHYSAPSWNLLSDAEREECEQIDAAIAKAEGRQVRA